MRWLPVVILVMGLAEGQALARRSPGDGGQTGAQVSTQKPVKPPPDNLARIRAAVAKPTVLQIENGQLRIYVEVIGHWPSFAEVAKGYDLKAGPTGRSSISHNALFASAAPKELFGAPGMQGDDDKSAAVINWVGQSAIGRGLRSLGKSRSDKEAEIRAQIDRELAAIKGGK